MVRAVSVLMLVLLVACNTEEKKRAEEAKKQAEIEAIKDKARAEERAIHEKKAADERAAIIAAAEKTKQEQEAKEAALKARILASPGEFLKIGDTEMFNKGILNSYRQLVRMSVTNKSKYPLEGIAGQVEWLDDGGQMREVTTFRLKGSLTGGDTKVYRVSEGTLESSTTDSHAHKLNVKVMTAKFVETASE